jgi:hypothetical protein
MPAKQHKLLSMRFDVLTATTVISFFWDVTPYSLVDVNRYFGGMCCFHVQAKRKVKMELL